MGISLKENRSVIDGHIGNKSNPHGVTAAQVGAAPSVHNHDSDYYKKGEVDTKLSGKSDTSHTHSIATSSADGFMSKVDKAKLDGVISGAQPNSITSVNGKTGAVVIGASDIGDVYSKTEVNNQLGGKANASHVHALATGSADGFMGKADKTKLDGIGAGANVTSVNGKVGVVTIVAADLSDVYSKTEVNNLLNGKANTSHKHAPADINQDASNRFVSDAEKNTWNASNDRSTDYSKYCSDVDENGIAKTVEWKRPNGSLYRKSVLNTPDVNGYYTKGVVTYYATNGTTVTETQNWTYKYDNDGNVLSEVRV